MTRLVQAFVVVLGLGCRPTTQPSPSSPPATIAAPSVAHEEPRALTELPTYTGGLAEGPVLLLRSATEESGRVLHSFHWFDVRVGKVVAHTEVAGSLAVAAPTLDGQHVVVADVVDPEPATAHTVFKLADRASGQTRRILEIDGWPIDSVVYGNPTTVAVMIRFKCGETLYLFGVDDTEPIAIELDPHAPTESLDGSAACDFGIVTTLTADPRGRWLATISGEKTLEFRDVRRGNVVRTADLGRRPGWIRITPDGRGIIELKNGTIVARDAMRGETQWSLRAYEHERILEMVAIDGDHVAVLAEGNHLTAFSRAKGRGKTVDVLEGARIQVLGDSIVVHEPREAIRIFDRSLERVVSVVLGPDGTVQLGAAGGR